MKKRKDYLKEHQKKSFTPWIIGGIIGLIVIVLIAVTLLMPKASTSSLPVQSSEQETSSTKTESQSQSSTQSSESRIPNSARLVQEMDTFMRSFSSQMGQSYQRYYPQKNSQTTFYGFDFVNGLDLYNYYVDGSPATIGLINQKTMRGTSDYNVIMAYSDIKDNSTTYTDRHLYLFTLHNNQPEVLVATQDQATAGSVYFRHTQNTTLKTGFENLYNQ
ncbi:DUF4767 domain-containing protein [Holzapfeliella sp. He02]|uniref:DUF4767 domain-containing protein n=1 Tax=Holzapfeliella saturejae TaxID=3082953 RepID=A0ABU8SHN5_9LACO